MIVITSVTKKAHEITASCYALMLPKDYSFSPQLNAFSKNICPDLKELLDGSTFTGAAGQVKVIPVSHALRCVNIICVGIGSDPDVEQYRRSLGTAVRSARGLKCESMAFIPPTARQVGLSVEDLGEQTAVIANMTNYRYDEYITLDERKEGELYDLTVVVDAKIKKAFDAGIKTGECVAAAVNQARRWVDTPPSVLTPPYLADKAKELAKGTGLKLTTFNEKQINDMGMGGLAGVSRGSDLEARLLIIEYKTTKKKAPTIAFVGKGITFDSGGLSIKPAVHMETMKEDMSGAAAVISSMVALAHLKPDVNVVGVTALAENLPSGKALKPGDIIRFYNGKTAEVRNTDAEGRLVLADALAYTVEKYKPDMMIDLATLTGACAYALGPFFSGLMSQHDDVVKRIEDAAKISGDRVWRLPLDNDYAPAIKSEVADMCNIGNSRYMAGSITATHFLKHFVGDTPWAHLDIAGTAFNVPDLSYYRPGATGVGVRLIIELAMSW